jgi:hypothetical protein
VVFADFVPLTVAGQRGISTRFPRHRTDACNSPTFIPYPIVEKLYSPSPSPVKDNMRPGARQFSPQSPLDKTSHSIYRSL